MTPRAGIKQTPVLAGTCTPRVFRSYPPWMSLRAPQLRAPGIMRHLLLLQSRISDVFPSFQFCYEILYPSNYYKMPKKSTLPQTQCIGFIDSFLFFFTISFRNPHPSPFSFACHAPNMRGRSAWQLRSGGGCQEGQGQVTKCGHTRHNQGQRRLILARAYAHSRPVWRIIWAAC